MVKAAPKSDRGCDDDGASYKDTHGSIPRSVLILGYDYKRLFAR